MAEPAHRAAATASFGGFELDLETGELSRDGRTTRLTEKPFEVLVALLERSGQLVSREELYRRLWSDDTFVDFDNNLNAAVSRLREALNDSAQGPRFIETIPRRGYRFVGPAPSFRPIAAAVPTKRRRAGGWWAVGVLALLAAAAGGLALRHARPATLLPPTGRVLLAVLTFEDLSGDDAWGHLPAALSDELTTRLAQVSGPRLGIVARTSARRYDGSMLTAAEIGGELGAGLLVEGSVRVEGDHVRVGARLVQTADQAHLWAHSYRRELDDLLTLEAEVATDVARSVLAALGEGRAPRFEPDGEEPSAFRDYLEGRAALARDDADGFRRATERLERALLDEPGSALVWAALARARALLALAVDDASAASALDEGAREAGRRALELDPNLEEARVALALMSFYRDRDASAAAEVLDADAVGRLSAEALQLRAAALTALGRHDLAAQTEAEGVNLDPASPSARLAQAWHHLFAGRPGSAETACRALVAEPDPPRSARECLYTALRTLGRGEEAVRALGTLLEELGVSTDRFRDVDPTDPEGALPALERMRLELVFERAADPRAPFDAAVTLTRLGETDRAFDALARAEAIGDWRLVYLPVDPRFAPLRDDPRWAGLLARQPGLAQQ